VDNDHHMAILTVWHELMASARSIASEVARNVLDALQDADESADLAAVGDLLSLTATFGASPVEALPVSMLWTAIQELAAAESYVVAASQLEASTGGVALVNVPDVLLPMRLEQAAVEHFAVQKSCFCSRALGEAESLATNPSTKREQLQ